MESNGPKIVALLVTLAVIVGLYFVFSGGDDDGASTTATTSTAATTTSSGGGKQDATTDTSVPVIKIVGGEPQGGVADLEFNKGEDVAFEVDSDTADEVHVHGYDIGEDVKPGGTVSFDFPADLEGVFEVELESSATQIAELTVNP